MKPLGLFEHTWRAVHPSLVNWFKMPRWLYWLSFRPRACLMCGRFYWGCWYTEYCSRACSDEMLRQCDAAWKRVEGMLERRRNGQAAEGSA